MINVIPVFGIPAAGKSTIFRRLLADFRSKEPPKSVSFGTARGYCFKQLKTIVLGIYDSDPFGGTDRLSMAVSPDVEKLIKKLQGDKAYDGWTLTWEGDRLSSAALFEYAIKQGATLIPYCIVAKPEEIARRQRLRSNQQNSNWRKGRESKVLNLCQKYSPCILHGSTKEDLDTAIEVLTQKILKLAGSLD